MSPPSGNPGHATFMPADEFSIRLKMTKKVSSASKPMAEGGHSGKRTERALIQKTADTIKSEFVQGGLSHIQLLIDEVLRQTVFSTNIVKGLAAFDPFIMIKRPTEGGGTTAL